MDHLISLDDMQFCRCLQPSYALAVLKPYPIVKQH